MRESTKEEFHEELKARAKDMWDVLERILDYRMDIECHSDEAADALWALEKLLLDVKGAR